MSFVIRRHVDMTHLAICIGHTHKPRTLMMAEVKLFHPENAVLIRRSIYAVIHLTALSRTGKFVIIDPLGLTIHHSLWHIQLCLSACTQLYVGLRRLGLVSFTFRGQKLL
jgi:hypothetical protein